MPDKQKQFVESVNALLMQMDALAQDGQSVADRPVGLSDADSFNVQLTTLLSREDIKANRRALANAISADKWVEGFKAGVALLRIIGVFL